MIEEFEITSSKGQVCIYSDYLFLYKGGRYTSIREAEYKSGFGYNIDNPYFIIEWMYNEELIKLTVKGLASDFKVDPKSNLIFARGDCIDISKSNKNIITSNSTDEWALNFFINEDGSINHQINPPKYVYDEDRIPWHTFLPYNKIEAEKANKISTEGIRKIEFSNERASLVGSYYYMNDSVQEREYDAINREWGAIVSAWKS